MTAARIGNVGRNASTAVTPRTAAREPIRYTDLPCAKPAGNRPGGTMRTMMSRVLSCVSAAALAASCGSPPEAMSIRIDGSSTVYPITEAVAEEFQRAHPGARVTVRVSGTGGGFSRFCRGETDISNASRPIKASEIDACRAAGIAFTELPIAYDGLVVVVHPNNTWVDHLTVEELRRIWAPDAQGRITRWSQVRAGWPDREMHLFGPGVDSG